MDDLDLHDASDHDDQLYPQLEDSSAFEEMSQCIAIVQIDVRSILSRKKDTVAEINQVWALIRDELESIQTLERSLGMLTERVMAILTEENAEGEAGMADNRALGDEELARLDSARLDDLQVSTLRALTSNLSGWKASLASSRDSLRDLLASLPPIPEDPKDDSQDETGRYVPA